MIWEVYHAVNKIACSTSQLHKENVSFMCRLKCICHELRSVSANSLNIPPKPFLITAHTETQFGVASA